MSKLLIVDTFGLIFRAFHAYPPLTTADGIPTNAIFGYLQMFLSIIEKQNPTHIVCSLESTTPTFRHTMDAAYKANRKPIADELKAQIPEIIAVINKLNVQILQKDGFEADDVIGSFATQNQEKFDEVKILTGDRDLLQLLSDKIRILMPGRFFSDITEYNQSKFEEKYNIKLEDYVLYKSLIGDSSDNIKGVPGIGPKTAEKIVNQFHSIESILANVDTLPPKIAESLQLNENLWRDYYTLSKIDTAIPLENTVESTEIGKMHAYELKPIIEKYELKTLQSKVNKFVDNFESAHGGFGLFGTASEAKSSELEFSIVDTVHFEHNDAGAIAYVLFAANPKRVRLGNGKEFIEIPVHETEPTQELYNFIILHKIKSFIGFDIKAFMIQLLHAGFQDIHSFDFVDLRLMWYVIKHDVPMESVHDLTEYLRESSMKTILDQSRKQLDDSGLNDLFILEQDLQKVLALMEFHGIACNKEYLLSLDGTLKAKISELTTAIYELVGFEFKINSPKELSHVLYNVLHLPVYKKTKTGISTDDDTLTKLEGQSDIIPLIKKFRMYSKALSTYVVGLRETIQTDGKIHSNFRQTVVATGRLSSINPNLQNLPQDPEIGGMIRQAFVPSYTNGLFVSFDYSQIDLRVLAFETNDPKLIESFSNDEDIHLSTARTIFGKEDISKEERNFAKTINFGIVYGMEAYGLSQSLKIPQQTAKEFIQKYLENYNNVKVYFEKITKELDTVGYVHTFLGRKRYFASWAQSPALLKKAQFREAINMPIQGGSSEIIKIAMIKVDEYIRKNSIPARLILQIHDELIFETDPSIDMQAFKKEVKKIMEHAYDIKVPLKVSTKESADLRM